MHEVCLVGFGAIGCLYAFAVEKSGKARVTAVCRSKFDIVQEHGLKIVSEKLGTQESWRPYRVVRTVEDAADLRYSFIVCATKCIPDVISTPSFLAPLLSTLPSAPSTAIVLLQNGIGVEDDLQEALAKAGLGNPVLSGCAWVDTTVVDGGRSVTQFGHERLVLGYHRPPTAAGANIKFSEERAHEALNNLCDMLRLGGASPEPVLDVDVARWRKVLWNASFSTICTLTRHNVGDILATAHARLALAHIMSEVLAIAHACLPDTAARRESLSETVISAIIEHENPASTFKPSMLVDLEAGRPMEVEAIVGGVLKRAQAAGVAAPKLEFIYASLAVLQRDLVKQAKSQ